MTPTEMTAVELVAAYGAKQLSPVEATEAVLARIEQVDGDINAMCLVDRESALEQARASEARWQAGAPQGLLDGVPTSMKDIFLTKGWPTLRGSRSIDPDQAWDVDAPVTARLREDGMVFVGKNTTPEIAWKGVTDSPLTGVTRNPLDTRMTAGGSSGGAAAIVAAGMGPVAVGRGSGRRASMPVPVPLVGSPYTSRKRSQSRRRPKVVRRTPSAGSAGVLPSRSSCASSSSGDCVGSTSSRPLVRSNE